MQDIHKPETCHTSRAEHCKLKSLFPDTNMCKICCRHKSTVTLLLLQKNLLLVAVSSSAVFDIAQIRTNSLTGHKQLLFGYLIAHGRQELQLGQFHLGMRKQMLDNSRLLELQHTHLVTIHDSNSRFSGTSTKLTSLLFARFHLSTLKISKIIKACGSMLQYSQKLNFPTSIQLSENILKCMMQLCILQIAIQLYATTVTVKTIRYAAFIMVCRCFSGYGGQ